MRTKAKFGIGAPLAIFGALALILLPLYELTHINTLLKLVILTFFAVLTGLGLALSISGFIDLKSDRNDADHLE
jgi:hypothetical protein